MKIAVGIYVALIFVFWIYLSFWGVNAHKSMMYNLGAALLWPTVLFPAVGKAIGVLLLIGFVGLVTFGRKA